MSAYKFTCDFCGRTFDRSWSDTQARQECIDKHGVEPQNDDATACDDCYKALMRGPQDSEAMKLYKLYMTRN